MNRQTALLAMLLSAAPLCGQGGKKNPDGWSFDRRPTLRHGSLRVDFRSRIQTDFRAFSPEYETNEGTVDVRRVRFGIQGQWRDDYEFEVDVAASQDEALRDVYVNLRHLRDYQLQIGKFKIPFGLDQTTPPHQLDFVYRSRLGDQIAPARDIGAMLHGRFFRRGLGYEAGFFLGDGENAQTAEDENSGKSTFAGRVIGTPLRLPFLPKPLRTLEIGGALTTSRVPAGLASLRGRNAARETIHPRVFVQGRRLRTGVELSWMPGPFSVKGEFVHSQTGRKQQSIAEMDLPDVLSRGWYLSGTWLITGEKKENRVEPRRPLIQKGLGAVELALRYEAIRFASDTSSGTPSRSPRAANLVRQSDRAWTFGVNWFFNQWSRTQFNAIHETIEDPQRTPLPGRTRYWMFVGRLQFVM